MELNIDTNKFIKKNKGVDQKIVSHYNSQKKYQKNWVNHIN